MSGSSEARREAGRVANLTDRWLGVALVAAVVVLFVVYAGGQSEHTFRFLAEWLVELPVAAPRAW